MNYWLDTNVLIQSANKIYKPHRYPEFWKFLVVQIEAQIVRSSEFVYGELVAGNDELAKWCKARKSTALNSPALENVQKRIKEVGNFIETSPTYIRHHKNEFFRGADAWLIAHAIDDEGTVVTHETERETGKIKVNSVCARMNVPCIDVYTLQDRLGFNPADYR